jgi:hypothetical protein
MSPVLIHVSTLLYAVAYNGFETLSRELDLTTHRTICRQLASAIMKNRNPKNLEPTDGTDDVSSRVMSLISN